MEKFQQLLSERAAQLDLKKSSLPPTRAVLTEVVTRHAVPSKDALAKQLFREDQIQQLFEQMNQVAQAQQRLQEGSYGICSNCAAPISPSRLQLLPETPFCLPCQREVEASKK
ncbi:MAG: TraR/DksA C4-type zinc finger protein [Gammaproteobacteria bacterium]